jgi:hypothetical protein
MVVLVVPLGPAHALGGGHAGGDHGGAGAHLGPACGAGACACDVTHALPMP